jgi:hypothetical protein
MDLWALSFAGYVEWDIDHWETNVRKFIFSGSVISSVLGGWGALQTTRKGPRDWRLILMWISWGATVAIAVGTVIQQSRDADELED